MEVRVFSMESVTGMDLTGKRYALPALLLLTCLTLTSSDVVSVTENGKFLIFSDGMMNKIHVMSVDGSQNAEVPVKVGGMPLALDYDPDSNVIYWTEKKPPTVRKAKLDGSSQQTLKVLAPISSPEGIAVDPAANLLFFSDDGRNTIHVMDTSATYMKTIVTDATYPRTVRVDPINRHIYWVDWGTNTIERANYDGSNRKRIKVSQRATWLNGLALDIDESHIYWTDALNNKIGRVNFNDESLGSKTYIVDAAPPITVQNATSWTSETHFFGVTLDTKRVYYTDWRKPYITRVLKNGSMSQQLGPAKYHTLNGIQLYDRDNYHKGSRTSCASNNNGCSHLCLPLPAGVTCSCPDGQSMSRSSKKTCKPAFELDDEHQLFWLEHDGYKTGFINSVQGGPEKVLAKDSVLVQTAATPGHTWMAVDYDAKHRQLLLSDQRDRAIMSFKMAGSIDIQSIHFGTSGEVYGVAVDWLTDNVYWTDAGYNWIMVSQNADNTDHWAVLIHTNLDKPHALAIYPEKGYMFWSDMGVIDKIERAALSGTQRKVIIVGNGLSDPVGLTIDYATDRLYWATSDKVESSDLEGNRRKVVMMHNSALFVDFALHGEFFFATAEAKTGSEHVGSTLWWMNKTQTNHVHTMPLNHKPKGLAVFATGRHLSAESPCDFVTCENLCTVEPSTEQGVPLTHRCICRHGFTLDKGTGKCVQNLTPNVPMLVFSAGDRLCTVPLTSFHFANVQGGTKCNLFSYQYEYHALGYEAQSGRIFFSDTKSSTPTIRKTNIMDGRDNDILIYGQGNPEGIVVEWLSQNLYWTSPVTHQIWVSRADGSFQKILIENLDKPHGITIDLRRRMIYWTEKGMRPRIGRAYLDGNKVETFYRIPSGKPSGITYDVLTDRIYWVDDASSEIHSLTVDKTSLHNLPTPGRGVKLYDVAITGDFIAFSDQQMPGTVSVIHKNNPKGLPSVIQGRAGERMFDVIVYDKRNQPYHTGEPCSVDNGGCEQLCLQDANGYHCACVDGMALTNNGKKCVPDPVLLENNFFLVSDDYKHQIYQMDADYTTGSMPRLRGLRFPQSDRPIPLDYDFQEDQIYWADYHMDIIKRAKLDGSQVETIAVLGNGSRVDGLALDPQSRHLYLSDMGKHNIRMMSLDGSYSKVILANVRSPRALAIYPSKGWLFYTTRDLNVRSINKAGIWRSNMDGSDPVNIGGTDHMVPNGIAIDYEEDMLYWCDQGNERIQAIKLTGTPQKLTVRKLASDTDPFSIAIDGSYIYWTDWNKRGIFRAPKSSAVQSDQEIFHSNVLTGANDIKIFRRNVETGSTGCKSDSCQYFCVPTPEGSVDHKCVCPDQLQPLIHEPAVCAPDDCSQIPIPSTVKLNCDSTENPRECWLQCKADPGRIWTAKCLPAGHWDVSNLTLVCQAPSTPWGAYTNAQPHTAQWFNQTSKPDPDPNAIPKVGSKQILTLPLIIALGVVGGVILVVIIILVVVLSRRISRKKQKSEYRDQNNMRADFPAMPASTVVYDANQGAVSMNKSYENPGYVTHEEVQAHRLSPQQQVAELPEKKPIGEEEEFDEIDDSTIEIEGVANPGYYFGDTEGEIVNAPKLSASDLERKPGDDDPEYDSLAKYSTDHQNIV